MDYEKLQEKSAILRKPENALKTVKQYNDFALLLPFNIN